MKHTSTGEMGGSTLYRGGDHGESYGAPAGGLIREACGTSGRGLSGTGYNNCCRFVDATAWPILLLAAIFIIIIIYRLKCFFELISNDHKKFHVADTWPLGHCQVNI